MWFDTIIRPRHIIVNKIAINIAHVTLPMKFFKIIEYCEI